MATISVNDGGTWKEPDAIHVKTNNFWKEVETTWVKTGGVWEQVYAAGQATGLFVGANSAIIYIGDDVEVRSGGIAMSTDLESPVIYDWDPGVDSGINTMALSGDDMYIGGFFTSVQGSTRNYIAAVTSSPSAADLLNWDPNANNFVYCIHLFGGLAYVGGTYTSIGGNTRFRASVVETDTSVSSPTIRAWDPRPNGQVDKMIITDDYVYILGAFTFIRSTSREYLGCVANTVDVTEPTIQNWDPSPNNFCNDMLLNGSDLFVVGQFSNIAGSSRLRVAAIDSDPTVSTPTVRNFNPGAIATPYTLVTDGSNIFIGGPEFGSEFKCVRALDLDTSATTYRTWYPQVDERELFANGAFFVRSITVLPNTNVLITGSFRDVNTEPRINIACIEGDLDVERPNLTSFDLEGGGNVLASTDSVLYMAANVIGGKNRAGAFNFDLNTEQVTPYDPYVTNVRTIALSGDICYLGGNFSTINGEDRGRLAATNAYNGILYPWNPNANNQVNALSISGDDAYFVGSFTSVSSTTRNRVAAVDSDPTIASPTLRSWDPNANGQVTELIINGNDAYIGGFFTTINGSTRNRLAAIDNDTSIASPTVRVWDPNCGSVVNTMVLDGADLYIGGSFTDINSVSRSRIAAIESDTSVASPTVRNWNPSAGSTVTTMALSGDHMFVGGFFTSIAATSRSRLAAIDSDTSVGTPTVRAWNPGADDQPEIILPHNNRVYVGGDFNVISGTDRLYFAALDGDVTQSTPTVYDLQIKSGNIVYAIVVKE